MGYNTVFHLDWDPDHPTMDDVVHKLVTLADNLHREHEDYPTAARRWKDFLTGEEETSWGDYDYHMTLISVAWPHVTFRLEGAGDQREDVWRTYFRDGRSKTLMAEIVHPPFDPADLAPTAPAFYVPYGPDGAIENYRQLASLLSHNEESIEEAATTYRNLYGHASSKIQIKAAGEGITLITVHQDDDHNIVLLLSKNGLPTAYTTIAGRTVTKRYRDQSEIPDDRMLQDLAAIRLANTKPA